MTARRTRRTTSSLYAENITPAITSIQPGRVPWNIAVLTAWRLGVWRRGGGRVVGRGGWVKEMPLSCGFSGGDPILWRVYAAFLRLPRKTGGIPRVFTAPRPSQGDAVNKAELTAALAMRTKMSKADAGRAIEALFDDKGIIAGELKKGAKVQISGFGSVEARKRATRLG